MHGEDESNAGDAITKKITKSRAHVDARLDGS